MASATVSTSSVAYVQIQTLKTGTGGHDATLASVAKAVADYNAALPKGSVKHDVVRVDALPNNVKGMQFQLALMATLARANGVTMIRLSVHGGTVALCGPSASIATVRKQMPDAYDRIGTLVANTYNATTHGNRVGFYNGFLCGVPAGVQSALKITPQLAYGIGYLFTFPAPGDGRSYAAGYAAGLKLGTPWAKATAPKTPKTPKAVAATTADATTADATTADATTADAAIAAA